MQVVGNGCSASEIQVAVDSKPAAQAHASLTAGRGSSWVRRVGAMLVAASLSLLVLASLAPLELISAYPSLPPSALAGPLGRSREISSAFQLHRKSGELVSVYLARLTETVASGMAHYWTRGDTWTAEDARYTGVSIYDNYLLWGLGYHPHYSSNVRNYEFVSPEMAIQRGYGFCSQVSKIVYSVLQDQGIDARIFASEHHVVVEALGSVLDADYGVFIPRDLATLKKLPRLVAHHYARYPDSVSAVTAAYAGEWRELGDREAYKKVRGEEEWFQLLKWLLPLPGLGAGLCLIGLSMALAPRISAQATLA